jgi:hypothetical protein
VAGTGTELAAEVDGAWALGWDETTTFGVESVAGTGTGTELAAVLDGSESEPGSSGALPEFGSFGSTAHQNSLSQSSAGAGSSAVSMR